MAANLEQPGATLHPAPITLSGVSSTFTDDGPLCAVMYPLGWGRIYKK